MKKVMAFRGRVSDERVESIVNEFISEYGFLQIDINYYTNYPQNHDYRVRVPMVAYTIIYNEKPL